MKYLQDGYFQLKGHLHTLTTSVTSADQNPSADPSTSAATTSAPLAAASSVMLAHLEPRVSTREHFSEDQRKFGAFKNACYYALQPRTLPIEIIKVGFIISLFSDLPQPWTHNQLKQKKTALNSVATFFAAMDNLYENNSYIWICPLCSTVLRVTRLAGSGGLRCSHTNDRATSAYTVGPQATSFTTALSVQISSVYHVPPVTLSTNFILPISLQVAGREVKLWAIIDCGACSCFLDIALEKYICISLNLKEQRLDMHLADGTILISGPNTQEKNPLSGNYLLQSEIPLFWCHQVSYISSHPGNT